MQLNQPLMMVEDIGKHADDFTRRNMLFTRVLEKVRAFPGVTAAGMTSALPLTWKGGSVGFTPEGIPLRPGLVYDANNRVVTPGYIEAMQIPIARGRAFEERDGRNAPLVAMINETAARQFWTGVDPMGRRFKIGGPRSSLPWFTIVGISKDVRQMDLDKPARAEMYFPYWQSEMNWMVPRDLVVHTVGDPLRIAAAVRQAISSVDRDQPVSNIQTLDDLLDEEVAQRRMQATLLGAFAVLALVLASIGIYGVLSFLVAQRTQEIGIRLALGAGNQDIFRNVTHRGMALAATGLVIGMVGALVLSRLIAGLLYGVSANDPATFVVTAAGFGLVALAACLLPARRAARLDPMSALRYE